MARRYLEAVADRAREVLGASLVGVYGMGSLALGDWDPARSDIDVAVVGTDLGRDALLELVAALDHDVVPVPARKLELVVYEAARLREGRPSFALNLNTGAHEPTTIDLDPATVPGFWFVLDLAIAYERAIAIVGPPLAEIARRPSEAAVDAAIRESLDWFLAAGNTDAAIMAAHRAYYYACTGRWASKAASTRWAEAATS